MTIIVRKGTEADFPAILELIRDLAGYERSLNKVKISVEQMRKEKKFFDSFVAEEDGKLVGIAIYFFSYSTWVGKGLYLVDLYVRPELRRKKVGTKLLVRIFELAKKEDCNRVRWQVLDWNGDAVAFYKKHGARISKEWLNCDFEGDEIDKFLSKNSG